MGAHAAWFAVGPLALVAGAELMMRGGGHRRTAGDQRRRRRPHRGVDRHQHGRTGHRCGRRVGGSGASAVGNIAGANIINLHFVLGLSALISPLAIEMRTLRMELPIMAGVAALLWVLAADGVLSRVDGLILVTGAVVCTYVVVRGVRRESRGATTGFAEGQPGPDDGRRTWSRWE